MKNIDIETLKTDLKTLEARIRELKSRLRTTWTRSMADEQADLLEAASEATSLYTLRAWARGRLHRTQPPRDLRDSYEALGTPLSWDAEEHNRKVAERVAPRYLRVEQRRAPSPEPRPPATG